ncbi:tyrosine-protein phosphatase [Paracoccus luteus]|uniref:tyrosine-protein phosphatase n=1 Tax=Paracoccus luteus TaxID=2508543 RepID=UPI001430423C|nr:tyrosine-protein phosphatase [Paracoccus luteus]
MRMIVGRACVLALAGLLALVGWFGGLHASGNFQTVVAGQLYRSGTLPADDLVRVIERHGIRSVVNLRGEQPGTPWYDAEAATTAAAGVRLLDFPIRAGAPLDEARAEALILLMAGAPKPLLIHCEGGADRTGLAAALYLTAVQGASPRVAGRQLSARYGHVGIKGVTYAWPMTESWDRLKNRVQSRFASRHGGG